MPRSILYGVQGEGRGHAARSLQVIQWLVSQGFRVKVFTGGDALKVLAGHGLDLEEIPLFRYHYRPDGSLCPWRTTWKNASLAFGLFLGMGRSMSRVESRAESFAPDLIISDFEPFLSRTARRRRIPLLAIDHQHFLTESVLPPLATLRKNLMLRLYQLGTRLLAGRPDRIITSSFYHFPKRKQSRAVFVGPFIPGQLRAHLSGGPPGAAPDADAGVVVYLKQPAYLESLLPVLAARPGTAFRIFSGWRGTAPAGLPSHVSLHPIDREAFLSELARSKALLTTAGNQVIGEAVYLGKPVLAFPEPEVLEQELNALALHQSGFGESFRLADFSGGVWDGFETGLPAYRRRIASRFRTRKDFDGCDQALRTLRRFLDELPSNAPLRAPLGAKGRTRLSFAR